jgi:hypothetical protein
MVAIIAYIIATTQHQKQKLAVEFWWSLLLANYPDVRWTFLFVHRPVWQASESDEKFMQIEAALQARPYTVFAGHAHTYEYQKRHGMGYIRLSTTGGVWVLDPPGNYDHIAWITMTDEGPVVANITLDGIFDKTGERKPVRSPGRKCAMNCHTIY